MLNVYDYWRSSAAYRVRIGLQFKRVDYAATPINLKPEQSEQFAQSYRAINPQARVPTLETDEGALGQSLAILEWLDETYPDPPFLPGDAWRRAQTRAFALTLACDVHPLNNLSVVARLRTQFAADGKAIVDWMGHWMRLGFESLENTLARQPERTFAFGDQPTLAEICLVPQLYNARRYHVALDDFPRLVAIGQRACELSAFAAAAPERQKDAEAEQ